MDHSNSGIFSSNEVSVSSNSSTDHQQKILKDNYSLQEINNLKLKEIHHVINELKDLCDQGVTLPCDRTCVDFATFVKEKNDYLCSLISRLHETEPSAFPKYRVEAYIKIKEKLETLLQDLKSTDNYMRMRQREISLRTERSINRCKALDEVMARSQVDKTQNAALNAISVKLAEEKLQENKKDMKHILEYLFEGNQSMKRMISSLVEASEQEDGEKKWLEITDDMDFLCVSLLITAGIVKTHPQNKKKITLVS